MTVLLTGATGFLGNNLLRELNSRQIPVVAAIRHQTTPESLAGLDFQPFQADLSGSDVFHFGSIPDFNLCIHSAAMINIGWTRVAEARQINVEATRRLAEFCLQRSARMILVSTVDTLACSKTGIVHDETNREPRCPDFCYPVTKREAENAVLGLVPSGLDVVIVHPGFMLGRWDWRPSSAEMIIAIAKNRPPFAPGGGANVVDVRDVAAGVLQAAANGRTGESYILGGTNISYFDLWTKMAIATGVAPPKIRLPNWLAMTAGYAGDLWGKMRGSEGPLNSAAAKMGQLFHYYSSVKAGRELDYHHRPIDEGLEQTAEWARERGWIKPQPSGQ